MAKIGLLGDGTLEEAAAILGLQPHEMRLMLAELTCRGFPLGDRTTGLLDLDAVIEWRKTRHPNIYHIRDSQVAVDAASVVHDRLRERKNGKTA